MANLETPKVDLIVLTRGAGPLHPEVVRGLRNQHSVQAAVHLVVGQAQPNDSCRWETIARARNEGKLQGHAPWLMFVDDDVVLEPRCVSTLGDELSRRPVFAALAADYLGDHQTGEIASHVSMGATLFRREALDEVQFRWCEQRCECQCCCDDLRRLQWAIDYCPAAKARHLPKGEVGERASPAVTSANEHDAPRTAHVPSVCLVACYFGQPPGWINQYLLGCAYNTSIDFLIITDQEYFPPAPPNVRVMRLSQSSFNALATSKTGLEISLSHPRKLCDFKPVYGHLFEKLLDGWDYWGYTDLDVIYGDIRRFLSAAKLQEFDVFTARAEFLVGHFTLFRNEHRMRMLYRESADIRTTLQSPHVLGFDECGKQWDRRLRGEPLNDDATCDSMTHVVQRMMAENQVTACFTPAAIEWPEIDGGDWRLRWQAGRLWIFDQRREAMYFHFHAFKDRRGYREPRGIESNAAFEMSPSGFDRATVPMSWVRMDQSARPSQPMVQPAKASAHRDSAPMTAGSVGPAETPAPIILTVFDRRHLTLFCARFLATLRAAGNNEVVVPVAIGLDASERERLARVPGVKPVFRGETGEHLARRRLRLFAEITSALPPATPVAYWDAGDVIFQSRLQALWSLVRAHPNKILAAREPSGYPDNPVLVQWTEGITDPASRRDAQRIIFPRPFINGGFLAGAASTLTKYFEIAAQLYDTPKLAGCGDLTDQLALNLLCHSRPEAWQEIPESWNYCLWGRKTCYRREDGRYVDARGVPIHIVHGNAHTLDAVPVRRNDSEVRRPQPVGDFND